MKYKRTCQSRQTSKMFGHNSVTIGPQWGIISMFCQMFLQKYHQLLNDFEVWVSTKVRKSKILVYPQNILQLHEYVHVYLQNRFRYSQERAIKKHIMISHPHISEHKYNQISYT